MKVSDGKTGVAKTAHGVRQPRHSTFTDAVWTWTSVTRAFPQETQTQSWKSHCFTARKALHAIEVNTTEILSASGWTKHHRQKCSVGIPKKITGRQGQQCTAKVTIVEEQ